MPLVVLLVLAELACRALPPPPGAPLTLAGGGGLPHYFADDPLLGWTLAPGLVPEDRNREQWLRQRGLPPDPEPEAPISPEGHRDSPLDHPRPPGQKRVFVMGDSSVYGSGVRREETFAQRLEQALNPGPPQRPRAVEVINGGVPGHSSFQALLRLEQALPLGIDGVVAYLMNSDLMALRSAPDAAYFGSLTHGLWRRLFSHSALGRRLHQLSVSRQRTRPADGAVRVSREQFQQNLQRLVQRARDEDFFLVFVVPPARNNLDGLRPEDVRVHGPEDLAPARALLSRIPPANREAFALALSLEAHLAGVPVVDGPWIFLQEHRARPVPADAPAGSGPEPLFVDPLHPSARGHALLAEALLPVVAAGLAGR